MTPNLPPEFEQLLGMLPAEDTGFIRNFLGTSHAIGEEVRGWTKEQCVAYLTGKGLTSIVATDVDWNVEDDDVERLRELCCNIRVQIETKP